MSFNNFIKQKAFENKILKTNAHRWHQFSQEEAYAFLFNRAKNEFNRSGKKKKILLIEKSNAIQNQRFKQLLSHQKIEYQFILTADLKSFKFNDRDFCLIISLNFDEKTNMEIGNKLNQSKLSYIPFEYVFLSDMNYQIFNQYDQPYYKSNYFVAPILSDDIEIFNIYQDSLNKYELKCDIRDYIDLYQSLKNIKQNNIPGDIVEFGSYKGHSGYLMARLLDKMDMNKKIYMYDMFSHFPKENSGIDAFWSKTHQVSFKEIKQKFKNITNVKLIKGDFTQTFQKDHPSQISLAYVDCDSYRSTEFIIKKIFNKYLAKGGIMVFEDFGHPALLGSRMAIKNQFNGRAGSYSFYSQFSGLYIVIKN